MDLEQEQLQVSGELQRLRVDFAATVRRRRELQRVEYAKTASSRRTLPLSPEAVDALRRQLTLQWIARQKASLEWDGKGLVFTTAVGTPIDHRQAWGALQRLLVSAGLPRMRFHDLRHTWASLSLRAGVPLWVVSKMLGHSSIALTANTYGHLLPASERDAVARLSALLREGGSGASGGARQVR